MKTQEFSRLLASKLKLVHFVLEPFGLNQGQPETEPILNRPRPIAEDGDYILLES